MHKRRVSALAAAVLVGVTALSACATPSTRAGAPLPPSPSTSAATTPAASSPAPTAASPATSGTTRPTLQNMACDTMLEPEVLADLQARGLSAAPKAWTQFGFTPTGPSIECPWGIEAATTADTFYAWAQLEAGQREQFLSLVADNGYLLEESDRGTWIVTPPESAGGGQLEGLVADEWVAFAETRDGVDDIVWAQ